MIAIHYLPRSILYLFPMARPPAKEEMTRKSIYGPKRLLERPDFSEYVVSLLEKDYNGIKPAADSYFKTIQTQITDLVSKEPRILREYKQDDVEGEAAIRYRLHLDEAKASASQISEIMTSLIKQTENGAIR